MRFPGFGDLGRSNVAARAGYVTLYPQDVGDVLRNCGIEHYAYQIVVSHDVLDKFTFRIAVSDPESAKERTEEFLSALYVQRSLITDALEDGTLSVPEVVWCRPEDLEYNVRTGKLKIILDKRL